MSTAPKAGHYAHPSAYVESDDIGAGTRIWHFCHVMAASRIGQACTLGQNVFVAGGVHLGNNVKVQNNVSLYAGTTVEDDVFLGPSCVLTNVTNPRSQLSRRHLFAPTHLRQGCTVGANATIVCGVTVGRYAFIAAGAVVTHDVLDYALIVGVPGRHVGYMSRHGQRLDAPDASGLSVCRESGWRYRHGPDRLVCIDYDAAQPLPERP